MTNSPTNVIGRVDTHKYLHHAAVGTTTAELVATAESRADRGGDRELLVQMKSYGPIQAIRVGGTGFYGAALTQSLVNSRHEVLEVDLPNLSACRAESKSDRLEAEPAPRALLGKTATAVPKDKVRPVEVIRILGVTRSSAVKAHSQAFNTLRGITIGCLPATS